MFSKRISGIFILIITVFIAIMTTTFSGNVIATKAADYMNYNVVDKSLIGSLNDIDERPIIIEIDNDIDVENVIRDLPKDFKLKEKIGRDELYGTVKSFSGVAKISSIDGIDMIRYAPPLKPLMVESIPLINTTIAWSKTIDGKNVTGVGQTVCVIDTGVDYNHPDLSDRIVGQYCFCNHPADGPCCPDGTTESNNASDSSYGHGTKVSGIIASYGSLKGVTIGTNLVVIRVCDPVYASCQADDVKQAFGWCLDNATAFNISVISISLGYDNGTNLTSCLTWLDNYIEEATMKNITVVAASGNDGYNNMISYPACSPDAISVGATFDNETTKTSYTSMANCSNGGNPNVDDIACFTNRNYMLDMLAPGIYINTTCPLPVAYTEIYGTSYAVPHVSGAISMLNQYEEMKNGKRLTPSEIKSRLKDTGKLIVDNFPSGNNEDGTNLTFSRLDVYSAIFPIDVYEFKRVSASDTYNVFRFKIKNNYNNKTKDVNWTFDIGNGTIDTSESDTSLSPGEDLWVFFEENYTDGDIYQVKATAASGTDVDTEEMTLTLGDIIAHDMRLIYSNGVQKVFFFKILNNMDSPQLVNWTLFTGTGGEQDSADTLTILEPGEDMWVYFENNYTSSGTYNVRARAFNVNSTDYTETVTVNVPA